MIAPDVGTIVEYGLDGYGQKPARWRVTSWLKEVPHRWTRRDFLMSGAFYNELAIPRDWMEEILYEAQQEVGPGRKKKMMWCIRQEATHLSLTGVCGAIAPVEECKIVGRVNWPKKQIDDERRYALRLAINKEVVF